MNQRRRRHLTRVALVLTLFLAGAGGNLTAATRYDPRLRFRTISTLRFDIHFHQGEEILARRLAAIAESVATSVGRTLGPADGRVQVVLVNQNDLSNGWATPVPYNLIEISAAGPAGASTLGNTDDWLRLVFIHEYTHIVHLGRSGGWIGGLRRAFGRNPVLFPNLTLPLWAIEGLATFEESAQTGYGRVNAGDLRQVLTSAATASRFEPLDRVGGGLDDWPGGGGPYAYGAFFHRYLADTYGDDALRRLADATGRRLPYFGAAAFRGVFGRSLGDLWSAFADDTHRRAGATALAATQLTHHGFTVTSPRFGADGRLYYSTVNPHGFPALMSIDLTSGEPQQVTTRYLGERLGVAGSLLVFDELETVANVALQGDLHAIDTVTGLRTRLTRGARAADPDVSPDGRAIAFTQQRDDRRDLVVAPLATAPQVAAGAASILLSAAGTEFNAPRWSPDGASIAVERHVRGGLPEIIVVDRRTHAVRVVSSSAWTRSVTPAWLPGGRQLLFAASRAAAPFQVFSVDIATGAMARLDGTGVSAQSPAVSEDGRMLAYVGYTTAGYDLFMIPIAAAQWADVAGVADGPTAAPAPIADRTAESDAIDRAYAPWRTLAPRFWTPTVEASDGEFSVGAATAGGDALGRHGYAAGVSWAMPRARPDWQVSYAYDRWRPTMFLSASDDTDPYRSGEARSLEVNAGVVVPWRRVRHTQSLFGAVHAADDTLACATCPLPVDQRAARRSVRGGYAFSSARSYGYSISREEGWSVTSTTEWIARALGSDGSARSIAGDLRAYQRAGFRHAVVAARIATAHSWGDDSVRRGFTAAGDGPQPGGFLIGADAIGLMRGFDDDYRGDHAMVGNLDYRFPLRRVQRGAGTLPAFVRTVHGALFADAGHAWTGAFRMRDARISVGAELSADTVLGYGLPLTFTAGIAMRHDGRGDADGVAVFGRIGRAF